MTRGSQPPAARTGATCKASRLRQTAIEAIHERGEERGINPQDTLAAMERLDRELRSRGWHPDQIDGDEA